MDSSQVNVIGQFLYNMLCKIHEETLRCRRIRCYVEFATLLLNMIVMTVVLKGSLSIGLPSECTLGSPRPRFDQVIFLGLSATLP